MARRSKSSLTPSLLTYSVEMPLVVTIGLDPGDKPPTGQALKKELARSLLDQLYEMPVDDVIDLMNTPKLIRKE